MDAAQTMRLGEAFLTLASSLNGQFAVLDNTYHVHCFTGTLTAVKEPADGDEARRQR